MANQVGRSGQAGDTPCLRNDTASALFPHASTYSPLSPENKMGRKTNKVQIKKRNASTGTLAAQRYEMEMGVNGRYRFVSPMAPGPAPRGIVRKAPKQYIWGKSRSVATVTARDSMAQPQLWAERRHGTAPLVSGNGTHTASTSEPPNSMQTGACARQRGEAGRNKQYQAGARHGENTVEKRHPDGEAFGTGILGGTSGAWRPRLR